MLKRLKNMLLSTGPGGWRAGGKNICRAQIFSVNVMNVLPRTLAVYCVPKHCYLSGIRLVSKQIEGTNYQTIILRQNW